MKFKPITPGMIIHCPSDKDAMLLMAKLRELGYIWYASRSDPVDGIIDANADYGGTVYYLDTLEEKTIAWSSLEQAHKAGHVPIEFSELIEPDNVNAPNASSNAQMSAAEVLEWIFGHYSDKVYIDAFGKDYSFGDLKNVYEDNCGELVQKIEQYEAAKAQKPVEVEYGWLCKIYDKERHAVDKKEIWEGSEEHAKDEAAERAKQYVVENGGTALYQVYSICRVKEVEA